MRRLCGEGSRSYLALKVNESKTAVGPVWGRKFLGYCSYAGARRHVHCSVARAAAANVRRWWHNSAVSALNRVLSVAYFDSLGVPRFS